MKIKILSILIMSMLITTTFLPVTGNFKKLIKNEVSSIDFIIDNLNSNLDNEVKKETQLYTNYEKGNKTSIEITKPRDGYLYLFDREIAKIGFTLIIGSITIEVNTSEDVDNVDIYIDGELKFSDYNHPYSRHWDEKSIGFHKMKAKVYDNYEITNESIDLDFFMINMNFLKKPKNYNVVINEIMTHPAEVDYYEWIELYNSGDDINIQGWTISNSDGNPITTLPEWAFLKDTYLLVNMSEGINDDDFSDGNATFYIGSNQAFFNDTMDECALYAGIPSDRTIVDFISYCYEGSYQPGIAHDFAVNANIWDLEEFFDTISSRLPSYFLQVIAFPGDTIARDANSTDTDLPDDWRAMGGIDSYKPTPGSKNLQLIEWAPSEMDQNKNIFETKEKKAWTVMVYIAVDIESKYKDLRYERQALSYINEMEKLGSNDYINIVVQVDFNKVCSGDTCRSYIKKDYNSKKITSTYTKISERNTGDPTHLTEFINWSMKEFPADKYALFLVGHGIGWKGLLKDLNSNGQTKTPDWLYMWELKQALDPVPLIDLICFNSCLMAMIEVAWQIHENAEIMIASQEVMNIKGFPYYKILENLNYNRYDDTEEFAENIVDLYHQFYSDKKTYDPCHTLSAIRLDEQLNHLITAVDQASQSLILGMEDWGDIYTEDYAKHDNKWDNCQMDIRSSLLSTEYFSDRNFKDLYDLAHNIRYNEGIYWRYSMDCVNIKLELEDVVIVEKHDKHKKAHGLSIYFPRDQVYFRSYTRCNGKERYERPFDYPKPSKHKDWSGEWRLYAEDHTIDNGKAPYFGDQPHPWPETPNLLFRDHTRWGNFLHRYYKPCADAGQDQTFKVDNCEECVWVTLNGDGSSSADDDLKVHKYTWDFNAKVDSKSGMDTNVDDMDRNGIDELDDELDGEGVEISHKFCVGTYEVTLTVWDDHHNIEDPYTNNHKNEHWKTDQDVCVITVLCEEDNDEPDVHITSPKNGATVISPINISGYATDYGGSGVAEIYYFLEWSGGSYNGDSIYIDPPVEEQGFIFGPIFLEDFLDLVDEWLRITIYAIDDVGNVGSDNIIVYPEIEETDNTPPITTATFDPELRTVTLTAIDPPHGDDPVSGVCATYYYINEGDTQEYYEPFTLPEGDHTVTFWSIDCAGNVEDPNTETFG